MTITQLEYVVALADHGSFVSAAKASQVTQPALTLQIKALEKELDLALFDRTHKPIRLTEAGRSVVEQARQAVAEFNRTAQMARQMALGDEGEVLLGIIPTVAPYIIPVFLDEFRQAYPRIVLNIQEDTTENLLQKLDTGHLDAAMLATPVPGKQRHSQVLFYEQFFVYVAPQHPFFNMDTVPVEQLGANHPWLLSEGNCFRNQVMNFCKLPETLAHDTGFVYQGNSIEALRYLVDQRGGLTFIPELATLNVSAQEEEQIKEVSPAPRREVSLVTASPYVKKPLLDKLVATLRQSVPQRMQQTPADPVVSPGF